MVEQDLVPYNQMVLLALQEAVLSIHHKVEMVVTELLLMTHFLVQRHQVMVRLEQQDQQDILLAVEVAVLLLPEVVNQDPKVVKVVELEILAQDLILELLTQAVVVLVMRVINLLVLAVKEL